ncbi:MAG: hypothetical protein GX943_02965 [Candidatus Pacebacteria bacterium]|jgi:DNA-binding MurR/RpiR family transcriptional regulator|nr:hypothetical protein [Candidatus Paceibacterota bacterium]
MLKEGSLENPEKLPEKRPVFIVVEDSFNYAQTHKQHLNKFGLDAVILRGIGNFVEQIAEIQKTKNVVGVITDGLHGSWLNVYEAAISNGIRKIWLISGNEDMINFSKYLPYTRAISKVTLHQNPDKYKIFLDALKE